jgi:transcriptional regulator of acetoin/glycerol metabolism
MGYHWPGNVREFQHILERAVIMSDGHDLLEDDIQLTTVKSSQSESIIESYNLDEIEQRVIERALRNNQGNVSKAASDLGLTRTSLYRRMEKYGL